MSHPVAEIFSQGEEVISGQITDTNATWLSQNLVQLGFVIGRHTAVGDNIHDLVELLNEISKRADICICTGGLGPTIDDLTAQAVAQAFDKPLQLDAIALTQIKHYFSIRKRTMAESNCKQAYLPQDSIRIDNTQGSAPGFSIKQNRCWFIFLPGVPSEMRTMFDNEVKNILLDKFVLHPDMLVVIKTIGIGESDLQQKLDDYSLPQGVQLGFRATTEEVQTKLLFPVNMPEEIIHNCIHTVVEMIGDPVFAVDGLDKNELNKPTTNLVSVISRLMEEYKYTLSVVETISQGLISAKCIGHQWLSDSNFKQHHEIENHDDLADSANTLAYKLKQKNNSDIILVQLYQDDGRQIHDSDTSIVLYNMLLTPQGRFQKTSTVAGSIHRKQNQAAIQALNLLRKVLQNKCHS